MEVKTPSQKTFGLEVMTDIEQQSTSTEVKTDISWKTLEDKHYRLAGAMNLIKLGGPYNYRIQSQYQLRLPDGQNTAIVVEFQHHCTEQERKIVYKVSVLFFSILLSRKIINISSITNKHLHYPIFPSEMILWLTEVIYHCRQK